MTALSSHSDEQLLAEKRPGWAGQAFALFYERHEGAVLAYFARRVREPELAADLAAETFAEALASRHRFRGGLAIGWLYGIARNVLLQSLRRGRVEDRARRRMDLPTLVVDDVQLQAIERLGADSGLAAALEALPPDQREAVRAHVLEEHSYAEIAAQLQCSQAVVRKRVSRGLTGLRQTMEEST